MPRIAAALGVFALVAVSIAVNIVRYPVVGEMIGPPLQPPPPAQAASPADLPEPAAPAAPAATETAGQTAGKDRAVLRATPVALPSEEEGEGIAGAGPSPVAAFASLATDADAEPAPGSTSGELLVPLARAEAEQPSGDQAAVSAGVRRLPPVEPPGSEPDSTGQTTPSAETAPIDPNTATEQP